MSEARGHIAIVGGGTAGWLAALLLQKTYARQAHANPPRISVVESPNIPTIGVGEGSTSILRQVLLDLGIEEEEFLRETKATIKFGIYHKNWSKKPGGYFGPIDDPNLLVPAPNGIDGPWLHMSAIGSGKPVSNTHLFTYLMKGRRAPVGLSQNGRQVPISQFHHAYHFDQARFGRFLASKASGIEHVLAEVQDVRTEAQSGAITHLALEGKEDLPVDFVVDCTGFRREIIGRVGATWKSFAEMLPLNKAMPFWLPIGDEIAPYTLAQAQSSGWMWNIATQERIGCGYVFSDVHQTPDQAKSEIEETLGREIEPRGLISIDPGRQEQAWIKNCLAIGLSQSFLEPLEATSIHGSLVQLLLFTQTHLSMVLSGAFDTDRARYNEIVAGQVDDFAEFINLHYAGGRTDTPFWRDMTESGLTPIVRERLNVWKKEPVSRRHFPRFPTSLPHVQEQLYIPVLDGLGLLPKAPSKAVLSGEPKIRAHARKTIDRLTSEFKVASRRALGHKQYLSALA